MVEGNIHGVMVTFTKEVFGWIKDKVKRWYIILLVDDTKAIGKMIRSKDKECYFKIKEQLKSLIDNFNI